MRIVNPDSDHHMHTVNFSDGLNTMDEMVVHAGKLGLKEVTFTDHSDAHSLTFGRPRTSAFLTAKRWRNVHNDVKVELMVEGDLLDPEGDVCATIHDKECERFILSAHPRVFKEREKVTEAYLNAIRRFHERIICVGHLDAVYFKDHVDVRRVVEEANRYGVPVELNGSGLLKGSSVHNHTRTILECADRVMVNSDAHSLSDLEDGRKAAFDFLKDNGFLEMVENRDGIEMLK
ncbi:MAG: PHP domain-containing protein [Candidatus Woesearchaeota archaeon]